MCILVVSPYLCMTAQLCLAHVSAVQHSWTVLCFKQERNTKAVCAAVP